MHPRVFVWRGPIAVHCRDAGTVTMTVPMAAVDRVPDLIRYLESMVGGEVQGHAHTSEIADTTLLREWSVSQPTIEE